MTKYKVLITDFAGKSIREIVEYNINELANSDAAISFLDEIFEEICSLESMPKRFSLIRGESLRSSGLRQLLVGNYFVYYWIDEENRCVHVTDVISAR